MNNLIYTFYVMLKVKKNLRKPQESEKLTLHKNVSPQNKNLSISTRVYPKHSRYVIFLKYFFSN